MQIVGSELKVPTKLAGFRRQRDDTGGIEVVTFPLIAIEVRTRIAGLPIDDIQFGIISAGEPRRAAAVFKRTADPCLRTLLTAFGNHVKPPNKLARRCIVSIDKASRSFLTSS